MVLPAAAARIVLTKTCKNISFVSWLIGLKHYKWWLCRGGQWWWCDPYPSAIIFPLPPIVRPTHDNGVRLHTSKTRCLEGGCEFVRCKMFSFFNVLTTSFFLKCRNKQDLLGEKNFLARTNKLHGNKMIRFRSICPKKWNRKKLVGRRKNNLK